jgi:hypothetical protein
MNMRMAQRQPFLLQQLYRIQITVFIVRSDDQRDPVQVRDTKGQPRIVILSVAALSG